MAKQIITNEKEDLKDDDLLLAKIRENFKLAQESYSMQREQAREDFKFRSGDQWDNNIRRQREIDQRPCLTVNKLNQFVRQVVNNQKINRPSINVNPADSQASIDKAMIYQAIIKNIEAQSFAENAYDTAFDNACTGGEGYFRIITDYKDPLSFDQDIYIKAIDNPFSVYIDPNFKSDFSDINWAFVFDKIQKDVFKREYPNSEIFNPYFYEQTEWISEDYVIVAEYFYIDYEDLDIVLLEDGTTLFKKDYKALDNAPKIVKERTSKKKIVKWVKTNGHEILESTVFPGEIIPIIPVFADTYLVDGQRIFEGVIRQAKDPQKAFNFWTSAQAEQIALAPKAPFIGVEGQFEDHEEEWNNSNKVNYSYLEYKPVITQNGQAAPAPQRTQFDPQIGTIVQAKADANEDLKATTGIYDPSLGNDKKEASGVALMSKQRQAEVTNFLFIDNLAKSLKYAGKCILGIIPIVYDTEREVLVKGKVNEEDKTVKVNSLEEKEPIFFNAMGKYDIDVSIGPYGENQRQNAIESMLSLMQINPQLSSLIGDIFVAKQDWDGAKEISERLKIMLPPELQGKQELPPELQAQLAQAQAQYEQQIQAQSVQLQQMQQLVANLTSELNKAQNDNILKDIDLKNKQSEIESKERIAQLNAQIELLKAGIKEDAADSRLAFTQELNYLSAKNKQEELQEEMEEQQGQPQPRLQDETVLAGVNDPVTNANTTGSSELSEDEQNDLLNKLDNFTQNTTRM